MHPKLEALKEDGVFKTLATRYMGRIFGHGQIVTSREFSRDSRKQAKIVRLLQEHGILDINNAINPDYGNVILKAIDPVPAALIHTAPVRRTTSGQPYCLWCDLPDEALATVFLLPNFYRLYLVQGGTAVNDPKTFGRQIPLELEGAITLTAAQVGVTYDDFEKDIKNVSVLENADVADCILQDAGILLLNLEGMIPSKFEDFDDQLDLDIKQTESTIAELSATLGALNDLKTKIAAAGGIVKLRSDYLEKNLVK